MNGCRVEEVVGAGVRRRAGSSRVLSGPLGAARGRVSRMRRRTQGCRVPETTRARGQQWAGYSGGPGCAGERAGPETTRADIRGGGWDEEMHGCRGVG